VSSVLAQPIPTRSVPETNAWLGSTQCLDAIRQRDPAAAQVLYTMYAGQIRTYLRRHTGIQDVENTVFSILVEAVRSVRDMEHATMNDLSQTVRELSQQGVFALRRNRASNSSPSARTLDRHRDLINSVFTVLDQREREILLRSFLLSENDTEISNELELPVLQIRQTRAKARVMFRIASQSRQEYVAAARA
jgi:DNA-directed RNA polymerase sigma subunit (sigma70/sigma32)